MRGWTCAWPRRATPSFLSAVRRRRHRTWARRCTPPAARSRRWTWRQSERGKITEETKAILFPIDGFSDVNAAEVQAAADELAALLHRFFGDGIEIEAGVVTRDSPRFEFFK